MSFTHLHVHTEFSLLDGMAKFEPLLAKTKEYGMNALAITDHGVMYGVVDFYFAAKEAGIKPILGCEVYVAPNSRFQKRGKIDASPTHLTLLAKDLTGFKNLTKLVTKAHLEGYYYRPRVDRELLGQYGEGLIALSGCASGEVASKVLAGDIAGARQALRNLIDCFGKENVYVEVQEHHIPEMAGLTKQLVALARELDLPLAAAADVHYVNASDAESHEILLCIQTNTTMQDPKRMRVSGDGYHLLSPQEMQALFGELPEALTNTLEIAERCNVELPTGKLHLPPFPVPEGYTPETYLEMLCREGIKRRYPQVTAEIQQRLNYELSVISKMGFAQYILIVWDFIAFARRQGILFGPRGSAAGSIVCYALGISDVEPLSNHLVFERFLNMERKEMPDIDVDFADDRREEMIRYVTEKYGPDHVAQIVTFGTLGARAAIRDVGRALGLPLSLVDSVAKMVPTMPVGITIDKALEDSAEFRRAYETDPEVKNLVDKARPLEGVARHSSVHAAGVIISPDPVDEHAPLQKAAKGDVNVIQYTMTTAAKIGLLKMDFLGLANLTMIGRTLENIRKTRGINLDMATIPRDDPKSYELLARGDTVGIFQLEGAMMRRYIRELRPTNLVDVASMVALYRPGPMAYIPKFIACKNGQEPIEYLHPLLEPILRDTYGIIVFQEQVLQIVQAVAGFTLGQADIFRRAMSKKKKEEMAKQRVNFMAGAAKKGIDEQTASAIFDMIEPFAGYAFNRAHASCYAWVAYQTAYLKANYPVEYMGAILSVDASDSDRVAIAVAECRHLGIPVLPPDVNKSEAGFTIESTPEGQAIRFGLMAIKNVSSTAIEAIVAAREEGGPFTSVEDFCRRVDLKSLNKRVLESLIKAGALDAFGHRGQLLAALDKMIAFGQQEQQAAASGQTSLFDFMPVEADPSLSITLPDVPDLPTKEKLSAEKQLLGLYLSDHPMHQAARQLADILTAFSDQLTEELVGQEVTMAGVVVSSRQIITKKRDTMLVAQLEDEHGTFEVVCFPRVFQKTKDIWQDEGVVIVKGKVDARDEERMQIICSSAQLYVPQATEEAALSTDGGTAQPAEGGAVPANGNGAGGAAVSVSASLSPRHGGRRRRVRHHLHLTMTRSEDAEADVQRFRQVYALLYARAAAGATDTVDLTIAPNGHEAVELEFPDLRLHFQPDLQEQIQALLGPDSVEVQQIALEE